MNNISTINIQKLITDSTSNLFETMLSMKLEMPMENQLLEEINYNFIGWVNFDGEFISGLFEVGLTEEFGRLITARMFDQAPSEIKSTQEILDVLKEISNIIGGNLKSRLCDLGIICKISPPSVVDSKVYKLNALDWIRAESYVFRFEEHNFFVRSYFKEGSR